ncbi:hypothetical protein ACFVYV_45155 [Streptomyces mirabilis]|uniref:hypothetical protein n=1 Tax=Streptomyces mirabilis TaxID=68239 RepID=UPI0036DF5099
MAQATLGVPLELEEVEGMSVATDHTGPWTVADVLALPEDRTTRYELLGESLVMSPAPGTRHQRASFRLHAILDAAARAAPPRAPVDRG